MLSSEGGRTPALPLSLVSDGGMGAGEALDCATQATFGMAYEQLLNDQELLQKQQQSIDEKLLELRERGMAREDHLKERKRLFLKRQLRQKLILEREFADLKSTYDEALKAAKLKLEQRAAKELAEIERVLRYEQSITSRTSNSFYSQRCESEVETAKSRNVQCQKELELKLKQLEQESRIRQEAEQQMADLCSKLMAQQKSHNDAKKMDAEWQMGAVAFARDSRTATQIESTLVDHVQTPSSTVTKQVHLSSPRLPEPNKVDKAKGLDVLTTGTDKTDNEEEIKAAKVSSKAIDKTDAKVETEAVELLAMLKVKPHTEQASDARKLLLTGTVKNGNETKAEVIEVLSMKAAITAADEKEREAVELSTETARTGNEDGTAVTQMPGQSVVEMKEGEQNERVQSELPLAAWPVSLSDLWAFLISVFFPLTTSGSSR